MQLAEHPALETALSAQRTRGVPKTLTLMAVSSLLISSVAHADGKGASLVGTDHAPPAAPGLDFTTSHFDSKAVNARGAPNAGAGGARMEVTGWYDTPQVASVGLALAIGNAAPAVAPPGLERRHRSVVDMGVRWRSPSWEQRRIDIAAYRRFGPSSDAYTLIHSADQPLYAARVEMQFKSVPFGGLTTELGAIGMQLEGGGKVVLRSKRGGPMVYYRSSF